MTSVIDLGMLGAFLTSVIVLFSNLIKTHSETKDIKKRLSCVESDTEKFKIFMAKSCQIEEGITEDIKEVKESLKSIISILIKKPTG